MRLAVAATSSVAQPTLDALLEGPHSLVRIFTTSDKPSGRGQHLTQSDVASWADSHSVECVKIARSTQMADSLGDIDCVVTIAFGILMPQEILDLPRHGFINLHFSLLPAWRGAAPVQRAIENGDDLLGITVFKLDAGMDTGPIYTKASFPRDPNFRSAEALEFLSREGVELISEALNKIESGVPPVSQSNEGATRALKLSKQEAEIQWSNSTQRIHQKVSAFFPNPIAFTRFRQNILKITMSAIPEVAMEIPELAAGEIYSDKNAVLIGTLDGALELVRVIPQGKSEMSAVDWARGVRLIHGEICG